MSDAPAFDVLYVSGIPGERRKIAGGISFDDKGVNFRCYADRTVISWQWSDVHLAVEDGGRRVVDRDLALGGFLWGLLRRRRFVRLLLTAPAGVVVFDAEADPAIVRAQLRAVPDRFPSAGGRLALGATS